MTCAHVLGIIDAGPFVDVPSGERAAALEHAHACAACGPALQWSQSLDGAFTALPAIAAPPQLRDTVLARIAELDQDPARMDAPAHSTLSDTAWPATATIGSLATTASFLLLPAQSSPAVPAPVTLLLAAALLLYSTSFLPPAPEEAEG